MAPPSASTRRPRPTGTRPGPARPDLAITSALVAAVAAGRRVAVASRGESGRERESEVDPWAVVVRHGRWYLLCYSIAPAVGETSARAGSSPPAWCSTRPPAAVAPWIRPPMGRLGPLGDGCVLTGTTRNPQM